MEGNNGEDKVQMEMNSPKKLLRRMFENQTGEWTMTSIDGKAFKFHKDVLAANDFCGAFLEQVPHFRDMFGHPETTECIDKLVVLPDELEMSSAAVEQFLRYVYYQDAGVVTAENFGVMCALIRAGHYFKIAKLVKLCAALIHKAVATPDLFKSGWFSVEKLWKLYQYVRLWEDEHPKEKLMGDIATALKRIFITENEHDLLPVTENPALRDLLVDFAQDYNPELALLAAINRTVKKSVEKCLKRLDNIII